MCKNGWLLRSPRQSQEYKKQQSTKRSFAENGPFSKNSPKALNSTAMFNRGRCFPEALQGRRLIFTDCLSPSPSLDPLAV
ncbi:hypothetical protein ACOMHN_025186 [Nucella lapillus]